MKTKIAATCLIAGLFMLPTIGYTADSAATTYVKDSVITTKVKAELAAEKMESNVQGVTSVNNQIKVVAGK